jgi:hypothetical protein
LAYTSGTVAGLLGALVGGILAHKTGLAADPLYAPALIGLVTTVATTLGHWFMTKFHLGT